MRESWGGARGWLLQGPFSDVGILCFQVIRAQPLWMPFPESSLRRSYMFWLFWATWMNGRKGPFMVFSWQGVPAKQCVFFCKRPALGELSQEPSCSLGWCQGQAGTGHSSFTNLPVHLPVGKFVSFTCVHCAILDMGEEVEQSTSLRPQGTSPSVAGFTAGPRNDTGLPRLGAKSQCLRRENWPGGAGGGGGGAC